MEISLVEFLLIASGCAVFSAITVFLCLSCCYYVRGRRQRKMLQKGERILYDIGSPCIVKINRCQPTVVVDSDDKETADKTNEIQRKQKLTMTEGESHYMFDERAVAEKAKNEDKTLVWTSKGQVKKRWEKLLL